MRLLAHISDLHFGTEDETICSGLLNDLQKLKPDLLVISGDLTQRGRKKQFIKVSEFLEKIQGEKIIVPGNHDIPLFDLFRRFFCPLARYRKFISSGVNPFYMDEGIAVLGINTARSFTWKNGRISVEQMQLIEEKLCILDGELLEIIVTHHPFIPPPQEPGVKLVGRSVKALNIIDKCGVDILLAGHIHKGYSGDVRPFYPTKKRPIISVQAGTAVSTRRRNEPNAYNLIYIERNAFRIEVRIWDGKVFGKSIDISYKKTGTEWIKEDV